jgi:hypothetical protein
MGIDIDNTSMHFHGVGYYSGNTDLDCDFDEFELEE